MEKLRLVLLAVLLAGVGSAIARTLLVPAAESRPVTPYALPATVPLPGWHLESSRPLAPPARTADVSNLAISGRRYNYHQPGLSLQVYTWYLATTSGDVKYYNRSHKFSSVPPSSVPLVLALRHHNELGYYYGFIHGERAYLSTCLNPRGPATVTEVQFRRNRYLYDLSWHRLLPWLLGQGKLHDRRCLWTHLSLPVAASTTESTFAALEQAGENWADWWRSRFPQP